MDGSHNGAYRRMKDWYHKHTLLLLWVSIMGIIVLMSYLFYDQQHQLDKQVQRNKDNTSHLLDVTKRLSFIQQALIDERHARDQSVCDGSQALVNSFLALQPPPPDVTTMWLQQARLNNTEAVLEQNYSAFHCDFHFTPIAPPTEPPPLLQP